MAYDPTNKRIYRYTSGGIIYGVGTLDIGAALGSTSRDIGTLCRSSAINKWAKYKAEQRNSGGTPIAQSTALTIANRIADKFGFSIPSQVSTKPYNLLTYYAQQNNGWQYIARTMDHREGDFVSITEYNKGYLVDAREPVALYSPVLSVVYDTSSSPYLVAQMVATQNTDEEVGFDDLVAALGGTLYFGVCLFRGVDLTPSPGLHYLMATADVPISRNSDGSYRGTSVSFAKNYITLSADKGEWTMVPFLSTTKIDLVGSRGGTEANHTFYPLPPSKIGLTSFTFASSADSYTIYFSGVKETLSLSGSVGIKNNTGSSLTVQVVVWLCDSRYSDPVTRGGAIQSWEERHEVGSVAIPAGQTVTVYNISVLKLRNETLYNNGCCYVQVNGTLSRRYSFLAPST